MSEFLAGLYVGLSLVAGVFFLRFWRDSNDPLFFRFAAAILILAAERIVVVVAGIDRGAESFIYVMRLVAFSLIIWAMIDKNREKKEVQN